MVFYCSLGVARTQLKKLEKISTIFDKIGNKRKYLNRKFENNFKDKMLKNQLFKINDSLLKVKWVANRPLF